MSRDPAARDEVVSAAIAYVAARDALDDDQLGVKYTPGAARLCSRAHTALVAAVGRLVDAEHG